MRDIPKAVTKESSKKKLWEELEASRDEIDQQQNTINTLRERTNILEMDVNSLRYQLNIIRSVLSADIKPNPRRT